MGRRRWREVGWELRMPKSMSWDEEMKLESGEGRCKNHLSFLIPCRDWSAGKKKITFWFLMSWKANVGVCIGRCSSHPLPEGFPSTHMHTQMHALVHDLKSDCSNETPRNKQLSMLLP